MEDAAGEQDETHPQVDPVGGRLALEQAVVLHRPDEPRHAARVEADPPGELVDAERAAGRGDRLEDLAGMDDRADGPESGA